MEKVIKELLDEAIEKELQNIDSLLEGDEKERAVRNLVQLHKLRIEEIKTEAEIGDKERELESKYNDQLHEQTIHTMEARENRIDRYVRAGVAVFETVLPLAFYGIWMSKGFKFEETGSFTSTTFRNLINRFRPTK